MTGKRFESGTELFEVSKIRLFNSMAKRKAVVDPMTIEPTQTVDEPAAITKKPTEVTGTQLPAPPNGSPQYEKLMATHLVMAAPCQHVGDVQTKGGIQIKGMMTDASYDLYKELNPGDAPGSILSLLAVSVTNASLDCLTQAARLPAGAASASRPEFSARSEGSQSRRRPPLKR